VTTLLLTRHGETDWNATHRWQGFTGPPLNELGRRQAAELADRLAGLEIHAVYSSDTVRAVETADIVAGRLGLAVRRDARLREVNFGEWEGLTRHEINERFAGAFAAWDECKLAAPTGGETDLEMAARVLAALGEIARAHVGGRVVIVTSGGPIRAVQAHAGGIEQEFARLHFQRADNCSLLELNVRDGSFDLSS
jgi:2,3-bisphosphoglycerate-dependent phosphoglycerate mutase